MAGAGHCSFGGEITLDIADVVTNPLPDPQPVFVWDVSGDLNDQQEELDVSVNIRFDHITHSHGLEVVIDILGFGIGGVIAGGFGAIIGLAGGLAVGQVIDAQYDTTANRDKVIAALGTPFDGKKGVSWDFITFEISRPDAKTLNIVMKISMSDLVYLAVRRFALPLACIGLSV